MESKERTKQKHAKQRQKAGRGKWLLAKKLAVNLCRLLLAATFLFSGFVKANDPFGMTYKLEDYLAAFGMPSLLPETFLLGCSVMLALLEFMLGVNMLFCIARKATARVMVPFMGFMTVLTLYIAIANPVSDCGCFGDAIVLSNTATLVKNIVLMACVMVMVKWDKHLIDKVPDSVKGIITPVALVGVVAYAAYCVVCLPVMDFRPFKIGTNLRANMERANSGQRYEVKIVYERNGKILELSVDDDDPDSTWRYVETKRTELDAEGMATADFYAEDNDGENVTEDILYADGYVLLLTIPNLREADEGCIDKVNEAFDKAKEAGAAFYCLTGSSDTDSQTYWREHTGAEYPFCVADERMLKTIVRGKPGMVLMKDGVIEGKWSNYNLPADITKFFE